MQLNNPMFDETIILQELSKPSPTKSKSTLELLQKKLKSNYFGDGRLTNEAALDLLEAGSFREFPRLAYVLNKIFSLGEGSPVPKDLTIPDDIKDWSPSSGSFRILNEKYGYFEQDLSVLFERLAISCRKMTQIIEKQAYNDEIAYKLMVLFYDPSKTKDENFQIIAKKFAKLIRTKQDKSVSTPYHDALIVHFNKLAAFRDVKDLSSWRNFIEKEGLNSLKVFSECATISKAFKNIKEAKEFLITKKYPRASENPKLAALCKKLLISNDGFEAGLTQVSDGWPKKESDNLPIVDIADESGKFFWVKLPPGDMRAMYLGNLIPGCCQHIDGDSKQCVIDGMRLSDNGFYVMLKAKNSKKTDRPRIINGEINDNDFSIVAQSYAWKSKAGNLCLDSIEWNKDRVTTDIIKDLMSKFSKEIFTENPTIKYLTVGEGGQTPVGLYPQALLPEVMKKGLDYGDSSSQRLISSNIKDDLTALTERLKAYPEYYRDVILYIAPYFSTTSSLLEAITGINGRLQDEIPRFLRDNKVNLPPSLTANDFKIISYAEYEKMEATNKAEISTICKIFNSRNEGEFLKWLPTIPSTDIPLIRLGSHYTMATQMECLSRLDTSNTQPLIQFATENDLSEEMLMDVIKKLPSEDIMFVLTKFSFIRSECYLFEYGGSEAEDSALFLEKLPEETRLAAVTYPDDANDNILVHHMRLPEQLKKIFELIPPSDRVAALTNQGNQSEKSPLRDYSAKPESIKILLDALPDDDRLVVIKHASLLCSKVVQHNLNFFEKTLELYPPNERLNALKQEDTFKGLSRQEPALALAWHKPDLFITMIKLLPESDRIIAVNHSPRSIFNLIAEMKQPLSAKTVLELLPITDRITYIKENGERLLDWAVRTPELLSTIIKSLPESERLPTIKKFSDGDSYSFLWFASDKPESFRIILELYPEDERAAELLSGPVFNNPLVAAYQKPEPDVFKIALESLPENKIIDVLQKKIRGGGSVLTDTVNHPDKLKIILDLLPKTTISDAIQQKDANGDCIYDLAQKSPELLEMIQSYVPKDITPARKLGG